MPDETLHLRDIVLSKLGDVPVPDDLSRWADELGGLIGHWFEHTIITQYQLDENRANVYFAVAHHDEEELQIMLQRIDANTIDINQVENSIAVKLLRLYDRLYNRVVEANSLNTLLDALEDVENFTNRYFPGKLSEVTGVVMYGVECLCRDEDIEPQEMFKLVKIIQGQESEKSDVTETGQEAEVIPIHRDRGKPK